jgi:hypothetical protein
LHEPPTSAVLSPQLRTLSCQFDSPNGLEQLDARSGPNGLEQLDARSGPNGLEQTRRQPSVPDTGNTDAVDSAPVLTGTFRCPLARASGLDDD